MPKKLTTRSAQYPLCAEFVINFNEWVVDAVSGAKVTFGSTVANSTDPSEPGLTAGTGVVFDCISMPPGAVIIGGEIVVQQAFVGIGSSSTLNLGIAGNTSALLSAFDLDAATAGSRTPLLLTTPLLSNSGQNLRLTTSGLTAAATAGRVRIRVEYTVDARANENMHM
jgi:hypothetical protein